MNTGTGGDVIATDDIGGVKIQRVKIVVGADGVNDGDVSNIVPMPVDLREVAGSAVKTGAGTESGSQRMAIATGGELAGVKTSLQIIDDWDDSDRAKVSLVPGEDGVTGDTGIVTSNTLRMTLATDIPLPAGTNNIGKVEIQGTPVLTNATGTSAIATSYAPSADFWLDSVTLHLSAAGSTAENFTITLNANDGTAYDTVLVKQDLSTGSTVDLVYVPEGGPMLFESGDAIDVAWPNTETRTYGLRIMARLA